jgi:hypothetical protein
MCVTYSVEYSKIYGTERYNISINIMCVNENVGYPTESYKCLVNGMCVT